MILSSKLRQLQLITTLVPLLINSYGIYIKMENFPPNQLTTISSLTFPKERQLIKPKPQSLTSFGSGKLLATHVKPFFIWQAYKQSLPTNIKLFKANCVINPLCPLCNLNQETHVHVLRDCSYVREIWDLLYPLLSFLTNI